MDESDFLEYIQAKARELKVPPAPRKAARPIKALQSRRMQVASRMTLNPTRAAFMTAEQAEAQWDGIEGPTVTTTRNVGPLDYGRNYCHGKDTGRR